MHGKNLEKQIGGNHYKKYKIQPVEFFVANNLDWFQASVIEYIMRHKDKGGKQDLDKAIHVIELYKELLYKEVDKKDPFAPTKFCGASKTEFSVYPGHISD